MNGKVSSGLIRKRGQFAQGYVLLAVWWVPGWPPFVPDTSPKINCFTQLECVSFLTANGVFYSVQVRGWRGEGVGLRQHLLNVLAPKLFISFTFGSFSLAWSVAMQISWNKKNFFFKRKDFNPTGSVFNFFLYTNIAASTSYESALWLKYSSLPLYFTK